MQSNVLNFNCDCMVFPSDTSSGEKLNDLLLFWTGHPALPIDLSKKLVVRFLDASKQLPEADTCPMALFIPTVHKSYEEFKAKMDKAIEYRKVGFGKM